MKYRKKPVVVEAIRFDGFNYLEIKHFINDQEICEVEINDIAWEAGKAPPIADIHINTLEGKMKANVGDYIIKGVNGEFYPCKTDIFEKTYEKVEE